MRRCTPRWALPGLLAVLLTTPNGGQRPVLAADDGTARKEDWSLQHQEITGTPEADLIVRHGDIDNLGFGWPAGFDPFSGRSTPQHYFPWKPNAQDAVGTDRIFVVSSYNGHPPGRVDGYTVSTKRPDNLPVPIPITFKPPSFPVRAAVLQIFVDDFQPSLWGARFQATMNDVRVTGLEDILNSLNQGGPIGKLITFRLPDEVVKTLGRGKLIIRIDDPTTGAGEGFAFDFFRLLINPRHARHTGLVTGRVVEARTGKAIAGASVTAGGVAGARTGAGGEFELRGVPAGLATLTAEASGYQRHTVTRDLEAGQTVRVEIPLESGGHRGCETTFGKAWDTDWGRLVVCVCEGRATGFYANRGARHGTLHGTVTGSTLAAAWQDAGGRGDCKLTLSEDGCTFRGTWATHGPGRQDGGPLNGTDVDHRPTASRTGSGAPAAAPGPGNGRPDGQGPARPGHDHPGAGAPVAGTPSEGPGRTPPDHDGPDAGVGAAGRPAGGHGTDRPGNGSPDPGAPGTRAEGPGAQGEGHGTDRPGNGSPDPGTAGTRTEGPGATGPPRGGPRAPAPGRKGMATEGPGRTHPGNQGPGAATGAGPAAPTGPATSTHGMTLLAEHWQVRPGAVVTVPVWLLRGKDLASLNFDLAYDPKVAVLEGVPTRGNLLRGALFSANPREAGLARLGVAGTAGLTGDGTVANLVFRAVGPAGSSTPLHLVVTTAAGPGQAGLPVATVDGSIRILGPGEGLRGDCNGDGVLDARDAQCALDMSTGLLREDLNLDMDRDGGVTAVDATLILQDRSRTLLR